MPQEKTKQYCYGCGSRLPTHATGRYDEYTGQEIYENGYCENTSCEVFRNRQLFERRAEDQIKCAKMGHSFGYAWLGKTCKWCDKEQPSWWY